MPQSHFTFEPRAGTTGRYRSNQTGRFVSDKAIRSDVERAIAGMRGEILELSRSLQGGHITVQEWYTGMRTRMKTGHAAVAAVAKGGWERMTQSDWGRVGQISRVQYEYLNRFARQINDGEVKLDGWFLYRAQLYGDALAGTYEEQKRIVSMERGYEVERRVLDTNARTHCDDCKFESSLGWQYMGVLKRIGDSECGVKCRCTFEAKMGNPDNFI